MTKPALQLPGLTSIRAIGRGGSARVYSAVDAASGHEVAIKVLDAALAASHAEQNFQSEIRSLEALRTVPGVVAVVGHGVTPDGDRYLIMPLLAGGSCEDLIRDGAGIGWRKAAQIVAKAAAAIESSHQLGIWHRDIKPANILRTSSGETFVSDFGIARFTDGSAQSRDGTSLTPDYAPPEVFAGKPEALSDVFSLGATLAALVTGHPPFSALGERASPLAIMQRVANDPSPDLTAFGAPAELARIAATAMAKKPSERQQSAGQLHDELAACLAGHADETVASVAAIDTTPELLAATTYLPHLRHGSLAPATAAGSAGRPTEAPAATPPPHERARRVPMLIAVAVLAVAGVIGAVSLARGNDEPSSNTGNLALERAEPTQRLVVEPTAQVPATRSVPTPTVGTRSSALRAVAEPEPTPTPAPTPSPVAAPSDEIVSFAQQATTGVSSGFVRDTLGQPKRAETVANGDLVESWTTGNAAIVAISRNETVEAWGIATCGSTVEIASPVARGDVILGEVSLSSATPLSTDVGGITVDYSPFAQGSGGFAAYFRHRYGGDNRASGFRFVSVGSNWRCEGPDGDHYCTAATPYDELPLGFQGSLVDDPYMVEAQSCVVNEYFEYVSTRNGLLIAAEMDFALER